MKHISEYDDKQEELQRAINEAQSVISPNGFATAVEARSQRLAEILAKIRPGPTEEEQVPLEVSSNGNH